MLGAGGGICGLLVAGNVMMSVTGSLEQVIALSAVLFSFYYIAACLSVIVLRYHCPDLPRPYEGAWLPVLGRDRPDGFDSLSDRRRRRSDLQLD